MSLSCILVVDDSEADQFLCRAVIEEYDSEIEILQAHDGQEAFEILESAKNRPQIIFLDINMPRMNGYEFLEAYEKKIEEKCIIVVMLTSSNQEKDKEKAMTYKCVKKYLEKPLSTDYLQSLSALVA